MVDDKKNSFSQYKKLIAARKEALYFAPLKIFGIGATLIVILALIPNLNSNFINYFILIYFILSAIYLYIISIKSSMNNICPFCEKEFFSNSILFTGFYKKNCQHCHMPFKKKD